MNIFLKNLTLTNFKGIRSFKVEFNRVTNILGTNATGKTSLKDAFLWLFFGKDSTDRKDFEVKTLDENNQPYHRLDHEVEAVIDVDGVEHVIRRSLREKWTKKRGEQEPVFTGHETSFFWNDVPMKESEFQAKVASVFNENIFKLITNTEYFNSMKWQDRRAVLMQIAGNISNEEVLDSITTISNKSDFNALINALNQKKTVDEFKKEIAAKKKKLKDELELIPARIDEANRSLTEEVDYSALEKELAGKETDLQSVEQLLMSKSKAEKEYQDLITGKVKEVGDLRRKAMQIESDERAKVTASSLNRQQAISDKKNDLRTKQHEKSRLLTEYANEEKRLEGQRLVKEELTKKWDEINKEQCQFSDTDFCCPTCKRAYEADNVEAKKNEMLENFNRDKAKRLEDVATRGQRIAEDIRIIEANLGNIKEKGLALSAEIKRLEEEVAILEEENVRLSQTEADQLKEAIANNTEHKSIMEMIALRNEEIENKKPADDNTELLARKKEIISEIDTIKRQLAGKELREKQLARITELSEQEAKMAQELARLEGTEFSIEQFIKAKMDELENRINGRFKLVRFKMFEEQINGGRVEACTTLINGVPYSDANTAAKIQAGLDIINTLSEHYDTYGPVWVDNRESVVTLPETKSQLINLVVSEQHKKLTVVQEHDMALA